MDKHDLIQKFGQGHLLINCTKMKLVQNAAKSPIVYEGKGSISLDKNQKIVFKFQADSVQNTDPTKILIDSFNGKSGILYSEDCYYTISATDDDGVLWEADRILPKVDWGDWQQLPSVAGEIWELSSITRNLQKNLNNQFEVHFFDGVKLPYNCCRPRTQAGTEPVFFAKATAAGYDFIIDKNESGFVVTATSPSPLFSHPETRVCEALQYILAKALCWRVFIKRTGCEEVFHLSSSFHRVEKTNLDPPVNVDCMEEAPWLLFAKYLEYLIKNSQGRFWHTSSERVYNVCQASGCNLDVWALVLCVSVEGLVGLATYQEKENDGSKKKELQKHVCQWMIDNNFPDNLMKRVNGILSQVNKTAAKAKLYWLAAQGCVDARHIKAWDSLRNKRAHAIPHDVDSYKTKDYQIIMDQINSATVLMYQLTFHLVGYQGKYSDYSLPNYPIAHYPSLTNVLHEEGEKPFSKKSMVAVLQSILNLFR